MWCTVTTIPSSIRGLVSSYVDLPDLHCQPAGSRDVPVISTCANSPCRHFTRALSTHMSCTGSVYLPLKCLPKDVQPCDKMLSYTQCPQFGICLQQTSVLQDQRKEDTRKPVQLCYALLPGALGRDRLSHGKTVRLEAGETANPLGRHERNFRAMKGWCD